MTERTVEEPSSINPLQLQFPIQRKVSTGVVGSVQVRQHKVSTGVVGSVQVRQHKVSTGVVGSVQVRQCKVSTGVVGSVQERQRKENIDSLSTPYLLCIIIQDDYISITICYRQGHRRGVCFTQPISVFFFLINNHFLLISVFLIFR